ncbi:MAG: DUF459 domain-containing protein [Alphaproteobacteria bacterium]|nr:DUF459 domain-containing protein [Alphaproteobacteria bacterium]
MLLGAADGARAQDRRAATMQLARAGIPLFPSPYLPRGKTPEPPPVPEKVAMAVTGDSLADGIWGAIYRKLVRDKRYIVRRVAKNSTGFTTDGLLDQIEEGFKPTPADAVIMMIGANDRRSFFVDGKSRALFGTPPWREFYGGRAAAFMDQLKGRDVPMVWILLPVMRDAGAARDAKLINELVLKAAADRPWVHTVETWSLTADAAGEYAAYFKDLGGRVRLMRDNDGVHFTPPGYELIAEPVLNLLREASPKFRLLPR